MKDFMVFGNLYKYWKFQIHEIDEKWIGKFMIYLCEVECRHKMKRLSVFEQTTHISLEL